MLWLLWKFIDHKTDEMLSRQIYAPVIAFAADLSRAPVGVVGLLLGLLITMLLVLSFVDTSPIAAVLRERLSSSPKAELPPPSPISEEDRRAIQDYRVLWNLHGREPVSGMDHALYEYAAHIKDKTYWGTLLLPTADRAQKSRQHFDELMSPQVAPTLKEVREGFNAMYATYLTAIRWVLTLREKGEVGRLEYPKDAALVRWVEMHQTFTEKAAGMAEDPVHHGQMAIYPRDGLPTAIDEFRRQLLERSAGTESEGS